ncbi:nucleotidyltransferase domain-containing protein [Fulvimarina sp. MAC8]|uniref:nucleotidyltransferase domain-containing protein n=1 Tax=Fulvimarina sp. MAC8 TaxID=3162874 RepID=UPI0032EEB3DB
MALVTVTERKEREASRRRASAERILTALAEYGRCHNGRYIVFGSAASGEMTYHSDFDVIVDFPPEVESNAILFVEDLCYSEKLPVDAFHLSELSEAFMARNGAGMRVLP